MKTNIEKMTAKLVSRFFFYVLMKVLLWVMSLTPLRMKSNLHDLTKKNASKLLWKPFPGLKGKKPLNMRKKTYGTITGIISLTLIQYKKRYYVQLTQQNHCGSQRSAG